MPRRQRPDRRPKVRIKTHPALDEITEKVKPMIGPGYRFTISSHDREFAGNFFISFTPFLSQFIQWCENESIINPHLPTFNGTVLLKLLLLLKVSKVVPIESEDNFRSVNGENQEGRLHFMNTVGCRVMHTGIRGLAAKIGESTSAVEKQLRLYRAGDLIVNRANAVAGKPGFIEFNPLAVWCGKLEHRDAYLKLEGTAKIPLVIGAP